MKPIFSPVVLIAAAVLGLIFVNPTYQYGNQTFVSSAGSKQKESGMIISF